MNLESIKPIVFAISLLTLLVLCWVNFTTLAGKPTPFEFSFTQIFFVLFPVWAFTIHYLNETTPKISDESIASMNVLQKIRRLFGNPPDWALVLTAGFYLYALYSLFLFMTGGIVEPQYFNGQYQVNNHGKITVYTEAEYQMQHHLHIRSVTGFFMAFFSVSTLVLAPWRKRS